MATRDDDDHRDASRLSFPLPLVWTLVATAITIAISVVSSSWSTRADIREILTKISFYEERYNAMDRKMELMRIDVENIKLQLAKAGLERD